ncbi:MAG: mobilization protein [Ginsengibacter sp.]
MMNNVIKIARKKGGRPKKEICRDQQLAVMCTVAERKIIEEKAKAASISKSEFLRSIGLKGHADRRIKVLPKEILLFTATLNHLAANINQVAKKRNSFDELNAIERAELNQLSEQVKQLAKDIKNYLQ